MSSEKKVMNLAEFNAACDSWGKRGKKWVQEGQTLGLTALALLEASGDIGPVNRLFCAMPKGSKSAAMAEWILAFGRVRANEDTKDKAKPFVYAKDKVNDIEGATKKPWFDFRPEPTPLELFDVQAAVRAIIAKAAKATNVEHGDMLEKLAALVGDADENGSADGTGEPAGE